MDDSVYGAVIVVKPLWDLTQFIWRMQTECQVADNPQTKPTDLDVSLLVGYYHAHPPSPFIMITQPKSWQLILPSHRRWKAESTYYVGNWDKNVKVCMMLLMRQQPARW